MNGGISADFWISLGVAGVVMALFLVALLVPRAPRQGRSTDIKLDDVRLRIDAIEVRQKEADHDLRSLRMTITGLATKDSVNAVAVQVAEMRGEVKGVVQNTAATTRSIERIENFLLQAAATSVAGLNPEGQGRP